MAFLVNKHVGRMLGYLPFGAHSSSLMVEYVDPDDAPDLPVRALSLVRERLALPDTRVVILTGDAGHGKTHLARRVLEEFGHSARSAIDALKADLRGARPFEGPAGRRSVRIVKDLSEISPLSDAVDLLREALGCDPARDPAWLICANEGKLRQVVAAAGPDANIVRETIEKQLASGETSIARGVHVINLNFQSVAAEEEGLLEHLLSTWIDNEVRWKRCRQCDAASRCPIFANREELAIREGGDPLATRRRGGLSLLVRVAEESGEVVTIRELLILVAYLVTGGLDCTAVHARVSRNPERVDWQSRFLFHQLLFQPPIQEDISGRLPLLEAFGRLDPGSTALRHVDEPLVAGTVTSPSRLPVGDLDEPDAAPRTRREMRERGQRRRDLVARLRRRDYFEHATEPSIDDASRSRRLGYENYGAFVGLRTTRRDAAFVHLRDRLIAGFHAVQGIRLSRNTIYFYLVDPAFSRTQATASIIARQLQASTVEVSSESAAWSGGQGEPPLVAGLDWTDRRIVVRPSPRSDLRLALDLQRFEYVMRAGDGLACRSFFRADIRRITSSLAALLEGTPDDGAIRVLEGDRPRDVVVDAGLIRSTEE